MSALWKAAQAQAATQGTLSGAADWTATGVSIDSRSVAQGDLFIALAGPNHDGHDHVKAAIEAGAAAALVHKVPEGCDGLPLLQVADTMTGLQDLGIAARARSQARILAITGSVGKTGSKEMAALALSAQGKTHYSVGSFNNHWGVPLSLARMPEDCAFGVFELGMNHTGELIPLSQMVRPHAAIVTTIEAVHSAFFASTEEIADAKAEIFTGIEPGGMAILPRDNRHFRRLATAAKAAGIKRIQSFGSHIEADARMLDCAVDPEDTAVFALLHDHAIAYRVGVPGLHWGMNSLAVLLAAGALGADAIKAAHSLSAMRPPKGRGERHQVLWKSGMVEVIDESYNASPVSMKAALSTLAAARPGKHGRRVAVLGDMLELGDSAPALHANLAQAAALWGTDLVCTAGALMKNLHDALPQGRRGIHAANSTELASMIKDVVRAGDVVVVKGSAGSRMAVVVKTLLEG
ncbi:MAG: UDP-N-acetylmuramoylalanyl-D-glutamyl-2,6-diaminopimelate--D-alanyl-D-alanine ligase [Magnetospirillum sp.]